MIGEQNKEVEESETNENYYTPLLSQKNYLQNQVQSLWSKYDIDGCNTLDKFESLAFLTELLQTHSFSKPDSDQFTFYFEQYDRQKTGSINEEDFIEFVKYYIT